MSQRISFAMAQARLQSYLNKRPRAFTSPTHVTPVRPAKRVPLQDIIEESQSADGDDLFSREERPSPGESSIDSLCTCAQLQLSFSEANPSSESREPSLRSHWSTDELQALVQFALENGKGDVWATHQSAKVWSAAAAFIQRKVGTAHARTSMYVYTPMMFYMV